MTKKEALLVVAEAFRLKVANGNEFGEEIKGNLKDVQKQYFPIKTTDLERSSNGAVNFEIVLEAFIKIFEINLNCNGLKWLFLVLREATSPYLNKIKFSLASYINKIIDSSETTFINEVEEIYKLFSDPNVQFFII